ncbi:MAG: amidohydrolase family protein [Pseudomonadota bacterium]
MTEPRPLFSVDSHVYIPPEAIRTHVPNAKKTAFDEAVAAYTKYDQDMKQGEELAMEDFVDLEAASHPGYREAPARLEAMDADGVAHEVMYNDPLDDMRFYNNLETVQDNLAAFNRALYDFASTDPNRILITYHLPITDIDFAVKELERVAKLGARSVQIPNFPSVLGLPDYHDKRYERLFSAFEDTGVVVAHHLSVTPGLWNTFRRDPTPQKGIFTGLPPSAMMEPMMWYFLTGILERHKKLRIVWVEPGLFWIPGFLKFLDRRMHQHYEFPGVKELPSTYWKRNMAVTFVDEPEAVTNRHILGVDNLLWSTDFPHPCCNWPNAQAKVEEMFKDVPDDEVRKITWGNAAKMYGFA